MKCDIVSEGKVLANIDCTENGIKINCTEEGKKLCKKMKGCC